MLNVGSMKMKTRLIATLLLICIGSLHAETLPNGRYFFQSDVLSSGLCDLVQTNGYYRLTHIERRNTIIKLKHGFADKIKIFDTTIGTLEYWISVSGYAKPRGDGLYSGNLRATYYAIPLIPMKFNRGTWTLRKAMEKDIQEGFKRGLEMASDLLWSMRSRRTENSEHAALRSAVGYGYSYDDLPQLYEMLSNGTITVENFTFSLKNN